MDVHSEFRRLFVNWKHETGQLLQMSSPEHWQASSFSNSWYTRDIREVEQRWVKVLEEGAQKHRWVGSTMGKAAWKKGKWLILDHAGQNMDFGILGCDPRTHSPETGSINHTQCLLLLCLCATFNYTWLVLSALKPDHEIISWGVHKAALKSVEH